MKRTHARHVSAYLTPICVSTLLRTMLLGCRLAALPTWQPGSDGIKRQSEAVLVTMAPDDPRTLYLVTYELGGLHRSADGGVSWRGMGPEGVSFFSLAVAPAGTIYAGADSGVYISRDAGRSWTWASRALGRLSIFSVTISPDDHDTVHAGSWGNNILRSTGGGRSWAPVHHGLETLSVYFFAINPANPRVLYAGTVEAIYKSTDGGGILAASGGHAGRDHYLSSAGHRSWRTVCGH